MNISRLLKIITGGIEAFLGIPFLGGAIILASAWGPLQFMFVFHLITLVICIVQKERFYGSILGLITSVVGYLPFVGMVMHIVTALVLLFDAVRGSRKKKNEHVMDVRRS
jgi:predicted branched-subunit amino acid permease